MDYYLKTTSEADLWKALEGAGLARQGEDGYYPVDCALDVIGTIYEPTSKVLKTDEGDVPEMKAIPGYHANLRCEELPEDVLALLPIIETPNSPNRRWL